MSCDEYGVIVWWHEEDRLVSKGEVLHGFEDRMSLNKSTGDLTIHGVTLADSGPYHCGGQFDTKEVVNVTVGTCLSF